MLPGGYCPQFFNTNKTLNTYLGKEMGDNHLLNLSSSKNGTLTIKNAKNGVATAGVFVDTACYSTVYRLEEIISEL